MAFPGIAQLLAQAQGQVPAPGYAPLAPGQAPGAEAGAPGELDQQALHQQLQQLQYAAAQHAGLMADQGGLAQAPPDGEAAAYPTYRNKARRKATEKPVVRPDRALLQVFLPRGRATEPGAMRRRATRRYGSRSPSASAAWRRRRTSCTRSRTPRCACPARCAMPGGAASSALACLSGHCIDLLPLRATHPP